MAGPKFRYIGFAFATALLATAASPPAGAQEKPWRHGILEAKSDSGIIMMVTKGFAEKQGLKLEILQFKSDVVELQALLSGGLESFEGGPNGAIIAAARGGDVKLLGCAWQILPLDIFVRSNITSVKDLKGKTIAISAPGASPDLVARALLAKDGLSPSDVRFANLGTDVERFKALTAGVADAAISTNEYVPIAEQRGIKLLLTAKDVLPNNVRSCMFSSGETLAARRDDAIRFVTAEILALRYALSHRAETVALTQQITGVKPDDPRPEYVFDAAVSSKSIDPQISIPREKLATMEEQLVKDGSLPHPYDLTKMFAAEIQAEALVRAGK